MTNGHDVIVVGGGLAGLAAGALATRAGLSAVVLEARIPGGRARVVVNRGHTFNLGAHALFRAGAAADVLASLGIAPTGGRPPLGRYQAISGGARHVLPTGPASLARTTALGVRSKAQMARLLAALPRLAPAELAGTSVSAWLGSHDLRPDARAVMQALVRLSTYASDLDDLAADAAVGQAQVAAKGVLYLDGGWAQLTDRLSALVPVRVAARVTSVEAAARRVEVHLADGAPLVADRVILAVGAPAAARALLPADPGWGDLGPPVTAACLDVGVRRVPEPGYLLGLDRPLYATVQSPPARQAPPGGAVVGALRYGARNAEADAADLEDHLACAGVAPEDVLVRRFLARMTVAGAAPRAGAGGLAARPAVTATGVPGVYLAGDWVGGEGLLADAALASARAASMSAMAPLVAPG